MKITIFGTGYVGLVTGACLADVGHNVLCMDVDQGKIEKLKNGQIPIYEPGLDNIVKHTVEAGRLSFTTDTKDAVRHGTLQFIAVGTPPDEGVRREVRIRTGLCYRVGPPPSRLHNPYPLPQRQLHARDGGRDACPRGR